MLRAKGRKDRIAKRFCTFILVHNASSRLHKVRISLHLLYGLAGLAGLSCAVAIGLVLNYGVMASRSANYGQIQAENLRLKVQAQNMRVATGKLTSKLDGLDVLSRQMIGQIGNDEWIRHASKPGIGGSKLDYSTRAIVRQGGESDPDMESLKARTAELGTRMKAMRQFYDNRRRAMRSVPSIWPLKGEIVSPFGIRMDPVTGEGTEKHLGVDISAPYGTAVHSPADGVVIFSGRMSDYGNLVIVDHRNGMTTRFAHLSRTARSVGQYVQRDDVIGYVGLSGRTTGAHLHYEVRVNDLAVNPAAYLPR